MLYIKQESPIHVGHIHVCVHVRCWVTTISQSRELVFAAKLDIFWSQWGNSEQPLSIRL